MIRDVGLIDRLIGIQIPLNISENATATLPLSSSSQEALSPFFSSPSSAPLTVTAFPCYKIAFGSDETMRPCGVRRPMLRGI